MNNSHRVCRQIALLQICLIISFAAFSQTVPDSVIRKKVNEIHNPLQRLLTLEPEIYQYQSSGWKDLRLPRGNQYGFSPGNVEMAFPELVGYQHHPYIAGKNMTRYAKIKMVDNESLIPVLVASIKELQAELSNLKKDFQTLKKETAAACHHQSSAQNITSSKKKENENETHVNEFNGTDTNTNTGS